MRREPYILIAEDDEDDRYLLEAAFKGIRLPVRLSFVTDGCEVLKYLNAIDPFRPLPDLILLDLNMPLMGGMDTLMILKEHDRYKTIPVIIHSTSENETEKESCLRMGAVEYIYKGTDYQKVIGTAKYIYHFCLDKEKYQGQ